MAAKHPASSRYGNNRTERNDVPTSASSRSGPVDAIDAVLGIRRVTEPPPKSVSVSRVEQPVTIERTSKVYKSGMVAGRLFTYAGVALLVYSLYVFQRNYGRFPLTVQEFLIDQPSVYVSMTGVVGGYMLYRLERFLAWWDNG